MAGGIEVEARGLFGGQRQKVDRFAMLQRGQRFQPAGQKDLLDQLVEFVDIVLQRFASLGVGALAQQRRGDGDAGQRRAQFVAAIGEQHPMGGDELLYALGRPVETLRQGGDLVAALDLHARAEVVAELLDTGLQPLEPPAEPAHHGISADRDGERHQRQKGSDPEGRIGALAHLAGDQPATVGQQQGEVRSGRAAPPALAGARRIEARRRPAGHGDHGAVRPVQGDVEAQLAMQDLDGALLVDNRCLQVGQQRAGQLGRDLEILRRARVVVSQPPQQRRCADEHRQHDEDGEVELEVEALHRSIDSNPPPS